MNRKLGALTLGAAIMVAAQGWLVPAVDALPKRFSLAWDPAYAKECGTCHMAYPPQLLTSAGWQRVMGHLDDHFGDSAQLDDATRQKLTTFLVNNSADTAQNEISQQVVASIRPGQVPERITAVPYIAGLHATMLDPRWGGDPRPKTLAECGVCHYRVDSGDFTERRFSVTDKAFRGGSR